MVFKKHIFSASGTGDRGFDNQAKRVCKPSYKRASADCSAAVCREANTVRSTKGAKRTCAAREYSRRFAPYIGARSAAYIIKGGLPSLYLISPFGAVSLLLLDDILAKSEIYPRFCADDIPRQVADDIHAFGVIGMREYEKPLNCFTKYDIMHAKSWF